MTDRTTRRGFLGSALAGSALAGLGDVGFMSKLRPVSAAETRLEPGAVRLEADIEPLVRLLERTPRDRLLEEVAARINRGLSYGRLLAALLLAGVRNVEPRPSVGFKFHAVLVVNSAHLAAVHGPARDRWLPIFWALDYFKDAQARDEQQRGWTMGPVNESAMPPPRRASRAFIEAMDRWDAEAADAAVAALARHATPRQVFELLFRYGARDYRSIGHKAIFVANSFRTLQVIGWHHAEPVLRSLAYALLNHVGEPNPARSDLPADRPWRRNRELADAFPDDWQAGRDDPAATEELLATLRDGSAGQASDKVVELLNAGAGPRPLWDAVFDGASELLLRRRGIVALHALTTANAMHQAYQLTADDRTRRLLLLQNAAFLPMFLADMRGRGEVAPPSAGRIDAMDPVPPSGYGPESIEAIFDELSRDRLGAARMALGYLREGGRAEDLIDAARRLVFLKGNDPHDYKFNSAVLEDYDHVGPAWRDRYLAGCMVQLNGSGEADNELVKRTRAALGA